MIVQGKQDESRTWKNNDTDDSLYKLVTPTLGGRGWWWSGHRRS